MICSHESCLILLFTFSEWGFRSDIINFERGEKGNKYEQICSALHLVGVCFFFPCRLKFLNLHVVTSTNCDAFDLTTHFHYWKSNLKVSLFKKKLHRNAGLGPYWILKPIVNQQLRRGKNISHRNLQLCHGAYLEGRDWRQLGCAVLSLCGVPNRPDVHP